MRTKEHEVAAYTWLRISAIAEQLDVSQEHVRGLILDGKLPAIDIGRGKLAEYRVRPEDFEAFLTSRKVAA